MGTLSRYFGSMDAWEWLGWAGQGFYFGRFFLQWWASERARRIVVPRAFWWMSVLGALCAGTYAFVMKNGIFLAAPCVNLFVFLRNLILVRAGRPLRGAVRWPFAVGLLVLVVLALRADLVSKHVANEPPVWLAVGAAGAVLWMTRFPLQWWLAERSGQATLPPAFFWVSFIGSVLMLTYACHDGRPVFIVGMLLSPLLYGRSLWLSYRSA